MRLCLRFMFVLIAGLVTYYQPASAFNAPLVHQLLQQVNSNEPDTQKSMDLSTIVREYKLHNADSAWLCIRLAYKLADKHNFIKGKAYAIKYMGELYQYAGKLDTVPVLYLQALKLFKEINYTLGLAETYFIIGVYSYEQGNYGEGLEYYEKSIECYRQINDHTRRVHYILNEMGAMSYHQGKYGEALYYYKKALDHNLIQADTQMTASTINNIGLAYEKMGDLKRAMRAFSLSYKLAQKSDFTELIPVVLDNIGQFYERQKMPDKALKSFLLSLRYMGNGYRHKRDHALTFNRVTSIYLDRKDLKMAELYLDSLAGISNEIKSPLLDMQCFKLASRYFEEKGDMQHALFCERKLAELNDSLLNTEMEKAKRGSELRSLLKKTELEVKKLAAANIEQKEKLSQNQFRLILLILITLVVLIGLVVLYINYRSKTQINKELEELNKERNTLIGIVSHDLKAPLASIYSFADLVEHSETKLNEEQQMYMLYIRQIIDNSFEMINNVMDLSRVYDQNIKVNRVLLNMGDLLKGVINQFKVHAAKKGITLIAENLDQRFEQIMADPMHIKRIAENLISNAIKFSFPNTKVIVSMECKGESLEFQVKDQGPGINEEDQTNLFKKYQRLSATPTGSESSNGLGLFIVKELTEMNNGKVWYEHAPDGGSVFKVSFPGKGL